MNTSKFTSWLQITIISILFLYPTYRLVPWVDLKEVSDYFQYYAVSKLMQAGHYNLIYNISTMVNAEQALVPGSSHGYFPFLIPPLFSWIFFPLAYFSFAISMYAWTIFLAAITIIAFLVLCKESSIKNKSKLWAAALLATSGPYLEAIRLGQLAPFLLLGLVLLYMGLKRSNRLFATVGQSIFWLKPQLLLPLLCFQSKFDTIKTTLFVLASALVGLVISCTIAGPSIIVNYLNLLTNKDVQSTFLGITYGPTLRGQLLKFSIDYDIATKTAFIFYLLLLVLAFLLRKRCDKISGRTNLIFTSLVPLALSLSPHLHNYDLLLLFPGLLLLSTYELSGFFSRLRNGIVFLSILCFISPVYTYLHYFYVLRNGLINPFFWTVFALGFGALMIESSMWVNDKCAGISSTS